jgi:hypothetical protein
MKMKADSNGKKDNERSRGCGEHRGGESGRLDHTPLPRPVMDGTRRALQCLARGKMTRALREALNDARVRAIACLPVHPETSAPTFSATALMAFLSAPATLARWRDAGALVLRVAPGPCSALDVLFARSAADLGPVMLQHPSAGDMWSPAPQPVGPADFASQSSTVDALVDAAYARHGAGVARDIFVEALVQCGIINEALYAPMGPLHELNDKGFATMMNTDASVHVATERCGEDVYVTAVVPPFPLPGKGGGAPLGPPPRRVGCLRAP